MNKEIKEKEFTAEIGNSKWTGKIKFIKLHKDYCVAEVEARDTVFTVVLTCYFEGYGMKEYCICVPNFNFGCKVSEISLSWNEEQFKEHIKNRVDRRSLACAIESILLEMQK